MPLTVAEAKTLVFQLTKEDFVKSELEGYWIAAHTSNYGGVAQRWLVVESETRKGADLRQLEQRLSKLEKQASKKLQRLCAQEFACPQDAIDAAESEAQQLKYHCLTDIQAVELLPDQTKKASIKASQNLNISYHVQATLVRNHSVIETETRRAGRFVVATNVIDVTQLSNNEMLSEYKAQQAAERGFGFLKDPLFFTDSVFLKSPERVEALAMLMGLSLLVYTLAQRQIRQALEQSQSGIKNQLGKMTQRPTLRWVFQCFQAVHLISVKGQKQISNLTDERRRILSFFTQSCRRYYLLC